ncbi:MAG: hypothetical protein AAGF12_20465 [Myxococcota bacterium]
MNLRHRIVLAAAGALLGTACSSAAPADVASSDEAQGASGGEAAAHEEETEGGEVTEAGLGEGSCAHGDGGPDDPYGTGVLQQDEALAE